MAAMGSSSVAVDADDFAGWSVSGAGDVNNDGIDDLIIGAKGADLISSDAGAAYVIYGQSEPMALNFDLTDLDGSNGFVLAGESIGHWFGASVSEAGDVNNDGIDDLVIGAFYSRNNGSQSGSAYVIFGRTLFPALVQMSDLDGTNGFEISAVSAGDQLGISVSAAGDVSADGIDDIIVDAHTANRKKVSSVGEAYVIFGRDDAFGSLLDLAELSSRTGWVITGGAEDDQLGRRVSKAGDINNDGIDDVAIHARNDDENANNSGAVYVLYGSFEADRFVVDVNLLDGLNGFVMFGKNNDDYAGEEIGFAGDYNGDGRDDFIIGAPFS